MVTAGVHEACGAISCTTTTRTPAHRGSGRCSPGTAALTSPSSTPPAERRSGSPRSTLSTRVFAHHWPGIPNLGDISTIDWRKVPPVDVLIGGFPCQEVSTVGKGAGLMPGTRSGLWSYMATAIDALQAELVVIENVRGLLSAPAIRPIPEGAPPDERNQDDATSEHATAVRNLELVPWLLGDEPARPLRALGAVLGDLADIRRTARWIGIPASLAGAPHYRHRVFITAHRQDAVSDPARVGRLTRRRDPGTGTGATGHGGTEPQVIDLAVHGPNGSPTNWNESETLFSLVESIFTAGGDTPTRSPDGSTSPVEMLLPPRS